MIASRGIVQGLDLFVLSHDLLQKVCNLYADHALARGYERAVPSIDCGYAGQAES